MATYYKAVRPDGTDFYSGMVRWDRIGEIVHHPVSGRDTDITHQSADAYLSVSSVATDCTLMQWPCRLLEVVPVHGYRVTIPDRAYLPHKRASTAWRVVRELPAHKALGPQGVQVAALIDRAEHLTDDEANRLVAARRRRGVAARAAMGDAARDAARVAAWYAARDTAWYAARRTTKSAARSATEDAAVALVVRDILPTPHYDILTGPWRRVIGPIHPDDPDDTQTKEKGA